MKRARSYNDPMTNRRTNQAFCLLDNWSLSTTGKGIRTIRKSPVTPKTAVTIYKAGRLIQLPVVMVASQDFWIGLQEKT